MELRQEIGKRLRSSKDWTSMIDELESEIGAISDVDERARRLYELGELSELVLLRKDKAMALYQNAFRLSTGELRALRRAKSLYQEVGQRDMVVTLLELELKLVKDPIERAGVERQIGIALLHQGKIPEAQRYLDEALVVLSEDRDVVDALAVCNYDREEWVAEVDRLRLQAEKSDSVQAARIYLRMALIYRMEGITDAAYEELLWQVVQNESQHVQGNALLEELLTQGEARLEELFKLHEKRVYASPEEAEQIALGVRFASFWLLTREDLAKAAFFYQKALETYYAEGVDGGLAFDGHLAAFDTVKRQAEKTHDLTVVEKLAGLALASKLSPLDKSIICGWMAMLLEAEKGDRAKISFYLSELEKLDGGASVPQKSKENGTNGSAAHDTTGKSSKKDKKKTTAKSPPEEVVLEQIEDAVQKQMDAARETAGANVEKGIEAWRKIVAAQPKLRSPRQELTELYRRQERWNALVELGKDTLEKVPSLSVAQKLEILEEMVGVYRDKLRLDAMVVNTYNAMLAIHPDDTALLDALAAQYEHMKRWPDLIGTLQKKAALASEPADQIEVYSRIAGLFQDRFSNVAEAIKAYEKVIEIDTANEAAIAYLKTHYEKRRDWEKLISIYQRENDRISDPDARAKKYVEVARLASDKIRKPAVSIALWSKVIEAQPDQAEALAELEKLYERERMWEELGNVCERQLSVLTETPKRVALLQKLGILFSEKTNQIERAIGTWKQLMDIEPDNRRAQDALKRLYLTQKNYAELEHFYAAQNKYDEYIRVLERQIETENGEEKIRLMLQVATLYRDKIAKADRARAAFEKVLAVDARNLAAAEALIPLYEAAKETRKLVGVLDIELQNVPAGDSALRVERLKRLADLSENTLKDKEGALRWNLALVAELPAEEEYRSRAERLAEATGRWEPVVSAYEAGLAKLTGEGRRALLMVLGKVYEQSVAQPELALKAYEEVLSFDEKNRETIAALERLYRATGGHKRLLQNYERRLAMAENDEEKKEIRFAVAGLFAGDLAEYDKAVESYRAILRDYGPDLAPYQALDRVYSATQKWSELSEVILEQLALHRQSSVMDLDAVSELRLRLGVLYETKLDQVPSAIEQYKEILQLDATHEAARVHLEQWLKDKKHQLAAAITLEPVYQRLENWAMLPDIYEIQIAHEESPSARVELLSRIGELFTGKLGDADRAFGVYARAFEEAPGDLAVRAEIERLALIQDEWPRLVKIYEQKLEQLTKQKGDDKDRKVLIHDLLIQTAIIYEEKLNLSDRALEYFRRAQAMEPDDARALDALEKLYTRKEQWDSLVDVYQRKAELTPDPVVREQTYFRLAGLYEEVLQRPADAISAYKEILSQDSTNGQALRSLDRLYVQEKRWRELADTISRQLQLTDDNAEAVQLLNRLAALREEELGEVGSAIETYRQVLERAPENPAAIAALEKYLPQKEHELVVAGALGLFYRARQAWAPLIQTLEVEVRHASDPARRQELLVQIAELHEDALDNGAAAFEVYARALEEDPSSEEVQGRLERLAKVHDRWVDLVKLYGAIAGRLSAGSGDVDLQAQLLFRQGQIYEKFLNAVEEAAASYEQVRTISPRDLGAIQSLENIYSRLENYEQLATTLLAKATAVTDVNERKELLVRTAQLFEQVLENDESAISVYQQLLEVDDTDRTALDSSERLYSRQGKWDRLKDVYQRKSELATSPQEKRQHLVSLARLYEEKLGDASHAIETYQTLTDLEANDVASLEALSRLYEKSGRGYDLLRVLEQRVELSQSTAEKVQLLHQIGSLWQLELKNMSQAVDVFRETLRLAPDHAPTIAALEKIATGEEEPVAAAQVLEPVLEAAEDWRALLRILDVLLRHASEPAQRLKLLHRIASDLERRVDDPANAFEAYRRALREDPLNEVTVNELERLAQRTSRWAELAQGYETEIAHVMDTGPQVSLLLRLARVFQGPLAQNEAAIAAYRRVLEVEPDNEETLEALDQLFEAQATWPDLADILRRKLSHAREPELLAQVQFRLGQVYENHLQDLDKAIEMYREILMANPAHAPTLSTLDLLFADGRKTEEILAILEPLYRSESQWEKLIQLYEAYGRRLQSPLDRIAVTEKMTEIWTEQFSDTRSALALWLRLLDSASIEERVFEEIDRLARASQAWRDVAHSIEQSAAGHGDPGVKEELWFRAGQIYETELQDLTQSEEAYVRALEVSRSHEGTLAALDRLYTATSDWSQLVTVLERRASLAKNLPDIEDFNTRLAELSAGVLGDYRRAISAQLAILAADAKNLAALEALERLYFQTEAWPDLYGIYQKLVDVVPGDEGMADCYARMAKIASDALGKPEEAVDLWSRVLDLRGEDPVGLSEMARLHEKAGKSEEVVAHLERLARVVHEAEEQRDVYHRLARVYGSLNRDRDALEGWQRALLVDPFDALALRETLRLQRKASLWEDAAETLYRLVELPESDAVTLTDRLAWYAELGGLESERLQRPEKAIDAWLQVLTLSPVEPAALDALDHLYRQEGRWVDCVEIVERKAQITQDYDERITLLMRAAIIWEEQIGDLNNAAELLRQVLAQKADAIDASERLEQIYRGQEAWNKLVELLLQRVDITVESATRLALYLQVSKIYETELQDPDGAFVILQAAFREDYTEPQVAAELERLAAQQNKWNELLADYTQMAQTLTEPARAAQLWATVGHWYGFQLGNFDYAIAAAQQALALNPTLPAALADLSEFFKRTSRWQEYVSTVSRQTDIEEDTAERAKQLIAMAEVLEGPLDDANQALSGYQRALEADPQNMVALEALERVYRRYEQWPALMEVWNRKVELLERPEDVLNLKLRMGYIYEERLADVNRAIETFREVLSFDTTNLEGLKALERLYEKTGAMEAYLDVLEQQLDVTGTNDERISLYERMAVAWEEQFRKPERACEVLEKILMIDERHETTLASLERLYRQERRWTELVETLRRHIAIENDTGNRMELLAQVGEVYAEELHDAERAIEAYNDILSYNHDELRALTQLLDLYERVHEWDKALEVASRLLRVTDDTNKKAQIEHRMGAMLGTHLNDLEGAEAHYIEALTLDPYWVPSMHALAQMYQDRADWVKAAQMLVRAEQRTANVLEKVKLLYGAAKLYEERLENRPAAAELYAQVLELDPEYEPAALPLANLYFAAEEWYKLEPILDMLVRKADKRDPRELTQFYFQLAKTSDALGNFDKAQKYYKAAYDLDSTHLPTLLGRADLLYRLEDWDGAFKIYQTILVHHRDAQKDSDVVEVFYRLGIIKTKQNDPRKALNLFEKALEVQSGHRPTLQALIDIQGALGDFEAVIHAKRSLLALADANEQIKILDDIAEVYYGKLNNPQKAISTYVESIALKPNHHAALHRLIELYSSTNQWKKAVEVILQLAEIDGDPIVRGEYFKSAATIMRDQLNSIDEAIDCFNRALDCYFQAPEKLNEVNFQKYLKAFEAIDKICTAKKDFRTQERNYRKMIKRLPEKGFDQIKVALWHALGEIYRTRLREYATAIQAFEVAASLEPNNMQRHEILAELYSLSGPDQAPQAAKEHMTLLKTDPFRVASYRALYRLYMETRQFDRAWCVVSALVFLQQADADESQFYEQYKPKGFVRAKGRLTDEMWQKNVLHPNEDRYIGAVFAAVYQAVALLKSGDHKQFGLKRKDKRDIANDQAMFSKVFHYVTQVMNSSVPEIYFRPEQPGAIQLANAREKNTLIPSIVVGAELLQGRTDRDLVFPIARYLTMLRPEHYLRLIIPTNTELGVALFAAIKLVQPNFAVPANQTGTVEQYLDAMKKTVQPAWHEQLALVVQRFIEQKTTVDLQKWSQAVELSAHRAGFLVLNDLSLAARFVQGEPVSVGGMSAKDKVKELLLYSISDEYAELREYLGLAIG